MISARVKVAFDSRPAKDVHGIGRYTRCLLEALRRTSEAEVVETRDPRRCQIFHSPWIDGALLRCPVPMVVTLHDPGSPQAPRGISPRSGLRFKMRYLAVERATRVIVPTVAVANDVVVSLRVDRDQLAVIPEAAAPAFSPRPAHEVEEVRERFGLAWWSYLSCGSADCACPTPASASASWRVPTDPCPWSWSGPPDGGPGSSPG